MKKLGLVLLFLLVGKALLLAQGSAYSLIDRPYHILDRLEIKSGIQPDFHSSLKYYLRGDLVRYALRLDTASDVQLSKGDRADLTYLFKDNNEWLIQSEYPTTIAGKNEPAYQRVLVDSLNQTYTLKQVDPSDDASSAYYYQSRKPIFNTFYKTPANLFEIDVPAFHIRVNPILNLWAGKARNDNAFLLMNQRGLEIRGGVDDRIYFYTNILESQARYPDYVNQRIDSVLAVPGAALYKPYKSNIFSFTDGRDFLLAQGYVGFNVSKHVGFQFGHGQNFIGNGYRSMFLSDFSTNYLYLKMNWRIWKLHLQNIIAEMAVQGARDDKGDQIIPKKYVAAHYLSYRPTDNLSFGLYEAVVFTRNNNFELQYLNPVILYRTIEQLVGSPDNVLLGFDFKWNLFKRTQLYGQILFDEFLFNELVINRNGWWANKYAVQGGIKYIDAFGVDHLDVQAELNIVRPYTYTHRDSSAHYSNYNQPLAHPLGANFKEYVFRARYQPLDKLIFKGRFILAKVGEDGFDTNVGANILLPNADPRKDIYGNYTGQGVAADISILGLEAQYELFHNMILELEYFSRSKVSQLRERNLKTTYIGGGIRINIAKQYLDF
ncbi:MAG: hypothetical protein KDC44_15055 [Phaeodactylibacter sp.]|nr:hypothetical protein [Phaeodactylibacter sp.]